MLRVVTIPSGSDAKDDDVVDISSDEDVVPLAPLWGPVVCTGAPPLRFKDYRRGRELGSGASGRVFVCHKDGTRGDFAVKTVDFNRLHLRSDFERARDQVDREVEIWRSLPSHRNVVHMVDVFREGRWLFMVLELVEHGDLFAALTSRRPPRFLEHEALHVMHQVVDGLSFLHNHGVIHRDIKLENILISDELKRGSKVLYDIKLTDFGLSKLVGHGRSGPHSCVGTRPYMAPEVAEGQSYDFSSDVWSLGVLLFVMVVGKFPFDDVPSEQAEVNASVRRIRRSPRAKGIVSGMLQRDPVQRVSMDALLGLDWGQGTLDSDPSVEPVRETKRQRQVRERQAAVPPSA